MINLENLKNQMRDLNPLKNNPREEFVINSAKMFLKNFNKEIVKLFNNKLTNNPDKEMIEKILNEPLFEISMNFVLTLLYDENNKSIVLKDEIYDEYKLGKTTNKFNGVTLFINLLEQNNSIEEKYKDESLIEYKIKDERVINNIQEYNNTLEINKNAFQTLNNEKYDKYIKKFSKEKLNGKTDEELIKKFDKELGDMCIEMMNDITKVVNGNIFTKKL